MITLDKLVFDPSAVDDGASVGAFLRASDGTLITHTDVSGKKALDVRVAEGINVEVDLDFADDSVTAHQGGTWEVSLDAATLAALESITVTATDLDIRDLTHVSDSVKIGDGTDFLAVNTDGSINVAQASATNAAYGAASVTNTATKIIATNLASRRSVIVQNLGNRDMFFGHNSSVTAANGIRISAGSSASFEMGAGLDVYGITSSGTASVRFFELA
jgi:hypothetical protein